MTIGILGTAHGHVHSYLSAWRAHPEWGVVPTHVWDHDTVRMAQAVKQHGLTACGSADELLTLPEIKGVVIAAETSRHMELSVRAAEAGKAIVLQKPMAMTLDEADRIVDAVEKNAVPFTMAWQMRADPQNQIMREMVRNETLGKVYSVRRRHGLGQHRNPSFAQTWHVDPAQNRDIWADDAAHPIDFLHWLLGMPDTVTAEMATLANDWMPNDNGIAIYRYADGPLAEVCCSFTCVAAENTTEIYCERGAIIQSFGDAPGTLAPRVEGLSGLKWFLADDQRWVYSDIPSPATHGERIGGLALPLANFLEGISGPLSTAEEGRASLRMVLATYVSSREGRRVRLDDPAIASV